MGNKPENDSAPLIKRYYSESGAYVEERYENGRYGTAPDGSRIEYLPDIKIVKEIGGTEYTVTGSYDGKDTLDKHILRIMRHDMEQEQWEEAHKRRNTR